jgi:hypothetical protein
VRGVRSLTVPAPPRPPVGGTHASASLRRGLLVRSGRPFQAGSVLRACTWTLLLTALAWWLLAIYDLVTTQNLVVTALSVAACVLAVRIAAYGEAPGGIGLVRAYVLMHIAFIQVGCVMIYVAFARERAIDGLYLEFTTRPALRAVVIPMVGIAAFLAGVLSYRRIRPRRDPVQAPQQPPARTRRTDRQVGSGRAQALAADHSGLLLDGTDPVRHQTRAVLLLVGAGTYAVLAFLARGGFPLLSVLGGEGAEDARLAYHYGSAPAIFSSSVVSQVYFALGPLIVLGLLISRNSDRLRTVVTAMCGGFVLFLLANSLERTTMVILTLWAALTWKYRKGRYPLVVLGVGAGAFILMTSILHLSDPSQLLRLLYLQLVRRVAVVNAMVNYFGFAEFGTTEAFRGGSTYSDYGLAIIGAKESFANEMMTLIYPGRDIGTAPVGAIGEAWVNFGWFLVIPMYFQGVLFAAVERWLAKVRVRSAFGAAMAAGVVVIGATTSYGGLLPIAFSGGVLTLVLAWKLITTPGARRRRLESTSLVRRDLVAAPDDAPLAPVGAARREPPPPSK